MNAQIRQEISDLASRATDGKLDQAGLARLEVLLKSSEDARRYYVRFMGVSANLAWAGRGAVADDVAPTAPAKTRSWRQSWGQVWAAAAILVLAMLGAYVMYPSPPVPAKPDVGVATLTDAVSIEWDQAQEPRHISNVLKPGWLRLKSGLAQVEFISGTTVWIEGPAAFRLDTPHEGYFDSGRLLVQVPHGSGGFRVDFPAGSVVDQGTAFGLDVQPGCTAVHVLEGAVAVTPNGGAAVTYAAGQAVVLDNKGVTVIASDPKVFDDMGYGWSSGEFGQLVTLGHPHHGPWGPPPAWKGADPMESIRAQLGVGLERWEKIKPILASYLELQWELKCLGFVYDVNDFSNAAWYLYSGTQKGDIADEDLTQRLVAYRQARQEVRDRRDERERDLKGLLTTREEALLADMGYLR